MIKHLPAHLLPVSQHFAAFASFGFRASVLHQHLCRLIADDPEILALTQNSQPGQPPSYLLFGAVQFLLNRGAKCNSALGEIMCGGADSPPMTAFQSFRDFCLTYRQGIIEILGTRRVQTNEVARSSYLAYALHEIRQRWGPSFSLFDIGCSLGLNLLWGHYSHSYLNIDNDHMTVSIQHPAHGKPTFCIANKQIPYPWIDHVFGVEHTLLDPLCKDDIDWLDALIWPRNKQRLYRFREAVALITKVRPTIVRAHAETDLAEIVLNIAPPGPVCVHHSLTLHQFSVADRESFIEQIRQISNAIPVFRASLEWEDQHLVLLIEKWSNRLRCDYARLAHCDPHGGQMELLSNTSARYKRTGT